MKRLMILLPVLNEAAGLDVVLEQIPEEALHELGWNSEIVIVDGNSTDNSRQIGAEAGCKVLVQPSKGKGEAIRLGFDHAIKEQFDACLLYTSPSPRD